MLVLFFLCFKQKTAYERRSSDWSSDVCSSDLASQILGADLVLDADEPISAAFIDAARQRGLDVSRTLQFPSMASAGDAAQLVSLKAVEPGYPLREIGRA